MVATEYHAATDLLRKQRPSESLQDYIAYWTEMCHHSMKMDPNTINNKLVIVLFVKNMYNKEICRRVTGAKNINTLLDAFKSAQMNLLKLNKYEGLVSDDKHGHTVHAVNQIMSKGLDMTGCRWVIKLKQMVMEKNMFHQLTVFPNRCPVSNSKSIVWKPISTAPTTLCPLLHMWCIWTLKQKLSTASLHTTELFKELNTSSHTTISKQTKHFTFGVSSSFSSKQFSKTYTATYNRLYH